jgi:hypothetical protein
MAILRLLRATKSNGILTRLKAEWDDELGALEDAPPPDVYEPMMAHADKIVSMPNPDPKYGIFAVAHCNGDDEHTHCAPYEAFVHISHKLPHTSDATLKVLWNLLAPRYQIGEAKPADMARIMSMIVVGAFNLSRTHMPAREIKMFLGNNVDREFATTAAAFLATNDADISFAVRGSWLHIQAT